MWYLDILGVFEEIPDTTDNLFVVSRNDTFLGNLSIGKLLTSSPTTTVREVMNTEFKAIDVNLIDSEVAILFQRYDLVSAPVIDQSRRLLGRITIDDVVDVIVEDADHSLLAMAGLSDTEDTFSSIGRTAPRRAVWLGVNLLTAILASSANKFVRSYTGQNSCARNPNAYCRKHGRSSGQPNTYSSDSRYGLGSSGERKYKLVT